jgi:hypothetical protein
MVRIRSVLLALSIFGVTLVSCSRPKDAPKPEPAADKWKESQSRSPMDDKVTYILSLDAEGNVPARPRLVIACSTGSLRVYVDSRALLSQDPDFTDLGWYTVGRYRFDQEKAERFSWETSNDHQAMFVHKETVDPSNVHHQFTVEFVDRLAAAQVFHLEYSPLNGGASIAEFDVRGLADHINHLKTQCPW